MNKKGIFWGLILILLAAYLVVSRLVLFPLFLISPFRIVVAIILLAIAISGLMKLQFFQFFFPLAIIGCMFDRQLHITRITPWTLIIVAILLAIGFDMIFKNTRRRRKIVKRNRKAFGTPTIDDTIDGAVVDVSNNFSELSKYVNSTNVKVVNVDNNFGQTNVYFTNAIMADGRASLNIDNHFGQTNVYIPRTWRIALNRDYAFGDVKIIGSGTQAADAPFLSITVDGGFGEVDIIFE